MYPKILCGATIYPDPKEPRLSTYCMRPLGHAGKHDIKELSEDKEELPKKELSKEELLKNYGPFSKDDPRATRGW